jgi:hypothetical protein
VSEKTRVYAQKPRLKMPFKNSISGFGYNATVLYLLVTGDLKVNVNMAMHFLHHISTSGFVINGFGNNKCRLKFLSTLQIHWFFMNWEMWGT